MTLQLKGKIQMDNLHEITLLFDFYGNLLTERQKEILELHYNDDYSLAEIAEQINISRQGVFDNIKRGKNTLEKMENKLGLVKKFLFHQKKAEEIIKKLERINTEKYNDNYCEVINEVTKSLKELMEI